LAWNLFFSIFSSKSRKSGIYERTASPMSSFSEN